MNDSQSIFRGNLDVTELMVSMISSAKTSAFKKEKSNVKMAQYNRLSPVLLGPQAAGNDWANFNLFKALSSHQL